MNKEEITKKILEYLNDLSIFDSLDEDEWEKIQAGITRIINEE